MGAAASPGVRLRDHGNGALSMGGEEGHTLSVDLSRGLCRAPWLPPLGALRGSATAASAASAEDDETNDSGDGGCRDDQLAPDRRAEVARAAGSPRMPPR